VIAAGLDLVLSRSRIARDGSALVVRLIVSARG